MAALLLGRRRPDAPDLDRFRLEAAHDALDQAALAGGVPAVDADQDPAAGPQVVDLQVEQPVLQLLELVLRRSSSSIGSSIHLDLVEARPFAHRVLHRRIVPARVRRQLHGNLARLTAPTRTTTNLADGRRPTHHPLHHARRKARRRGRRHLDGVQPARHPARRPRRPCRRRARQGRTRIVDAKQVERLDTAGALEILTLAGGGPDAEIETAGKGPCRPVRRSCRTTCARRRPSSHVNWLAHWLEEIGRNTVHLYRAGRQSLPPSSARSSWSSSRPACSPSASASTPWCARCTRCGSARW